ncbi:unnamed protein product [Calicophoron daubneyi]|uniref:1-phosphatidylinositol-5-phosphate 4-kinase n=1 Tax=Calicophoron daubneyi TaxID=300641 RepID=A0AAV2SYH4_CALDB
MTTISKQKKIKNVRQKLKLFRANEPLKSVLMWGINYSVSALNHVKPRAMLLKDDFKAYMKVKINNYLFNKENMPSRFKFKEYCPMVFKTLRDRFGVDRLDYWDAFTRHQPLWDSTHGKSGSKFLVTYNRQFVAKTISSEEVEQMHQILEEYYAYIVNCHAQTLLPQYLGLYRLTVNDQETYILVMRNVFSPRLAIHKKYDLKFNCACGSAVDREANDKEKSKPVPTLKDNDFLNDICRIHIGPDAKDRLIRILEADIQFLQENNLMDYSLLIGIHEVGSTSEPTTTAGENGGGGSAVTLTAGAPAEQSSTGPGSEDKDASAGDGLGSLASQWRLRRSSAARRSIADPTFITMCADQFGGSNLSGGDEEDDDETMVFSDTGGSSAIPGSAVYQSPRTRVSSSFYAFVHAFNGNPTPPDSPPDGMIPDRPFSGELHPHMEYYGIKSSPDSPKQVIYFIAIIDALTRYGMRKRTAQTYKTVKHGAGAEISTVKPDLYGRRLLEFISQCIE